MPRRARCSTTTSSPSTRSASTRSAPTSPTSTRRRCSPRPASTAAEIDDLAAEYLAADRVIITWAMGLTQHKKAVATIKEIVNLLLLRGNIGKPGAGASPIRGHSNVQGDRTMGIWERMPERLPRRPRGRVLVPGAADARRRRPADGAGAAATARSRCSSRWAATSSARSPTRPPPRPRCAAPSSRCRSRRSSTARTSSPGEEALILPTLGRTEIDLQEAGIRSSCPSRTACAPCTRATARSRRSRPDCSPRWRS